MHAGLLIALTRAVPRSIVDCELTHLARAPIDVAVARGQHDQGPADTARARLPRRARR